MLPVVGVPIEISNSATPERTSQMCRLQPNCSLRENVLNCPTRSFWISVLKRVLFIHQVTGWLRFEQPHHGQQTTLSHHIQTSLLSNAYQRKKGRSVKLLNSAAVEIFRSIKMRRNKQISVYTPAQCNLYLWNYYNPLPRHCIIYPPARHIQ